MINSFVLLTGINPPIIGKPYSTVLIWKTPQRTLKIESKLSLRVPSPSISVHHPYQSLALAALAFRRVGSPNSRISGESSLVYCDNLSNLKVAFRRQRLSERSIIVACDWSRPLEPLKSRRKYQWQRALIQSVLNATNR